MENQKDRRRYVEAVFRGDYATADWLSQFLPEPTVKVKTSDMNPIASGQIESKEAK